MEFDSYASEYDIALNQGLSASGEDKSFFVQGRIRWLSRCLLQLDVRPSKLLDFGCGTGSSSRSLLELLRGASLVGIDVSSASLSIARQLHADLPATYLTPDTYICHEEIDLAYCNGVFHHISPADRIEALQFIRNSLKPGGFFSFWENNPWNPGTRYVMRKIPFDRDAITITSPQAKKLLVSAGFEVLRRDFLFIFPRPLSTLRWIEPCVCKFPLGAQYHVLCRKPQETD